MRTTTGPAGGTLGTSINAATSFITNTESMTVSANERLFIIASFMVRGQTTANVYATLVRSTTIPPTAPGSGGINLANLANQDIDTSNPTTYLARESPIAVDQWRSVTLSDIDAPGAGTFNYSIRVTSQTGQIFTYQMIISVIRVGI